MCEETWYGRDTYSYKRVLRPRKKERQNEQNRNKRRIGYKIRSSGKGLLAGYLPDENSRDYVAFKIAVLHREYVEMEMSSSGE